jgi:hypothetical protein
VVRSTVQPVPTVQVWRIIYQGKQYFTEVDAVLLLGNGLDGKIFGRVSTCGIPATYSPRRATQWPCACINAGEA